MNIEDALKGRRTVRRFKGRSVPKSAIYKLIDAARWAPSACNKQLCRYVIIDKPWLKQEIINETGAIKTIATAPVFIVVLYRKDFSFKHAANVQSAAAAIQNMLLKAYSLGIGTAWIAGIGGREHIKRLLHVPENYEICAFIAAGYPDENPMPPKREGINEIAGFNKFFSSVEYPASYDPNDWTIGQIARYRDNCIRATSPGEDVYPYGMKNEFEKEIRIAAEWIKHGKILEILPFAGTHMFSVAKSCGIRIYHAWELSHSIKDFIEKRRNLMKMDTKIVYSSGTCMPYNQYFDTITCFQKLETVPDSFDLLAKAGAALKDNGVLILSFRNMSSLYRIFYYKEYALPLKKGLKDVWNYGPFKPLKYKDVMKRLKNAGFVVEGTRGISILPGLSFDAMPSKSKLVILKCRKML